MHQKQGKKHPRAPKPPHPHFFQKKIKNKGRRGFWTRNNQNTGFHQLSFKVPLYRGQVIILFIKSKDGFMLFFAINKHM